MASFPDPAATQEISPTAIKALLDEGEAFTLVDCREQDEWDFCHLKGASLMPLSEFGSAPAALDSAKRPIVVYCHHGIRSLQATAFLRASGYKDSFSMSGGIDLWSKEVDPRVPRY